jgi:hypothetical protein
MGGHPVHVGHHHQLFTGTKKSFSIWEVILFTWVIVTSYCLSHFVNVNIDIPAGGLSYLRGQNKSII